MKIHIKKQKYRKIGYNKKEIIYRKEGI